MDKPHDRRQSDQQRRLPEQPLVHPATHPVLPARAAAPAQVLLEVSSALLAARDALTRLSLALKDWQFEHDLSRREDVRALTKNLLAKLAPPVKPHNRDTPGR